MSDYYDRSFLIAEISQCLTKVLISFGYLLFDHIKLQIIANNKQD
jgi:hypothetical protein